MPHHEAALSLATNEPVVIFGAGNLGKRVASALKKHGVRALAFCDNNRAIWGRTLNELEVMSPASAAARFPDALFMVAIWHPSVREGLCHHLAFLHSLGVARATTFISAIWTAPDDLLPNMLWETPAYFSAHRGEAEAARVLLDDAGRAEFDRQWQFRLEGDLSCLADPEMSPQYFPPDLFHLSERECFVDCGAYDGDTLAVFLQQSRGAFARYIALEPEPKNFAKLQQAAAASAAAAHITVYPYAVGARNESLSFASAGDGSSVAAAGELKVQCVALDELLREEFPTFIKMDIEGFELEALSGARHCIQRSRPKLAICIYHRPDHLWRVPLAMHELLPNSRLTLRSYYHDGFDTVCYCLPQ